MVGSEGTLVIATEVEVGLVPKPKHTVFAVGHFDSTQRAIEATTDALSCDPAQVELMDKTILDLSRRKIEYADLGRSLAGDPAALLFVSFTGDDLDEVQRRLDTLIELWQDHGHGYHVLRAVTPAQQGALLKVRKASLGLLMAASEGANRPLAFVEDTAVPPERLADYTARFAEILDAHQMRAGFYGHCSVGCLHIRPFVDLSRPDEIVRMRAVAEQVKDLVREFGGVNSSEHGDGLARSEFNREIFGDRLYEAMRSVKQLFDPQHLLNPGKIVDAPPMTENLRDAALPPPVEFRTRLDFSVTGGMRGAADRCMNIGLCRKSTTGVMCPSYIATREEEHATRGRANALVKALTEPDPAAALGDERLHEILDLCLMCKACKAECPLGVDMAKLKSETLAHHHDRHGVPLRSRVFAAIRRLNRLGSATAPLSNLPGAVRAAAGCCWGGRWGSPRSGRCRGSSGRTCCAGSGATGARPTPRRPRRARWFSWPTRSPPSPSRTSGAPLSACWRPPAGPSSWPAAAAAAARRCPRACSTEAAAQARAMVTALAQGAAPDSPIVGCEPSCLFTLRDEHASMLPGDPRVAAVAARVRQVEELLSAAIDEGRLVLAADSWLAGRRVLYHGHCHQKAEVGTAATTALLRRIPGIELVELDAGCCGMAGSFGYEAEHYAISMKVGADRLFPAIDAENPDTVVAATGTSCREQISHGTGRHAWHPVELVAQALTRS